MEAMINDNQINHFAHRGHVLSLADDDQLTEYTCDLCKISGNNLRYKCTTCPDFKLDLACATCKEETTTFMYPDHIFKFKVLSLDTTICSVCNRDINGGHYVSGDFHVHPVCTKFPEIIKAGKSPAHPDHALKGIFSSNLTTCHVCRGDCTGLRYQCEEEDCGVDFHPSCLVGFGDRDMMDEDDPDGNNRGLFGRRLFQGFQGVMLGVNIWDLVSTLIGLM